MMRYHIYISAMSYFTKTSFLESFSYPPIEMMATGGYSVVVPNDGNREYLVNGELPAISTRRYPTSG